jgi:hypothetical protein
MIHWYLLQIALSVERNGFVTASDPNSVSCGRVASMRLNPTTSLIRGMLPKPANSPVL